MPDKHTSSFTLFLVILRIGVCDTIWEKARRILQNANNQLNKKRVFSLVLAGNPGIEKRLVPGCKDY
jgi:hypothetical protein